MLIRFCCLATFLLLFTPLTVSAGDISLSQDADTGSQVIGLKQGATEVKLAPGAGANVFSIIQGGVELLKTPKSLKDLPGFVYGVPVLYPMPNRVRDSAFEFDGQKYKFEPNNDANFLHGLVHSAAWEVTAIDAGKDSATITCRLKFQPGEKPFKLFPFKHDLILAIRVSDGAVRWTYTVDNSQGDKPVPFGFALHPWILYQGPRDNTYVTINATNLMESEKLLPTGKLLDLTGSEYDARKPKSLEGFFSDDVYFGMSADKPTDIDFHKKMKITLTASEDFTHLVLYTPKDQPWFCVENQTCSTDAHNMHAKGFKRESHLQIVPPGKTASGFVEFKFDKDGK